MMKFFVAVLLVGFCVLPAFAANEETSFAEKDYLRLTREAFFKMDKYYFREIDKKKVGNLFYRCQIMMMNLLQSPAEAYQDNVKSLTYSTLNLMVKALKEKDDGFSKFIYKDYLKRVVREQLKSSFAGIGIEIEKKKDLFFVRTVYKASSASEKGVIAGDRLVSIAGERVSGWELSQIEKRLKIPDGAQIELELMHPGADQSYKVTLSCRIIKVPSVSKKYFEDRDIGLVKVSAFRDNTAEEARNAISSLLANDPQGLILDLRGNGGGDETQAIELSSLFLDKGSLVVYFVKRNVGRANEKTRNEPMGIDLPIVILVDKKTASSAEIFAGAMERHKRAVLVGESTKGYGSLKNTFGLHDGSALFLITSRTYLPDDTTFDKTGLQPNIEVKGSEYQLQKAFDVLSGRVKVSVKV